jgi:hypothetical protein
VRRQQARSFSTSPAIAATGLVPGYLNRAVFREGENWLDHVANVNVFLNF